MHADCLAAIGVIHHNTEKSALLIDVVVVRRSSGTCWADERQRISNRRNPNHYGAMPNTFRAALKL